MRRRALWPASVILLLASAMAMAGEGGWYLSIPKSRLPLVTVRQVAAILQSRSCVLQCSR